MQVYEEIVQVFEDYIQLNCIEPKPPLIARVVTNYEDKFQTYTGDLKVSACNIERNFHLMMDSSHHADYKIYVKTSDWNEPGCVDIKIMEKIQGTRFAYWNDQKVYCSFPFNHPSIKPEKIIFYLKKWLNIPYIWPPSATTPMFNRTGIFLDELNKKEKAYRVFVLHFNYKRNKDTAEKKHFLFRLTPELFRLVLSMQIHPPELFTDRYNASFYNLSIKT